MLIQVLVKEQIEAGAAVWQAVERAGIPISGAFWVRIPDGGHWRLVIGSEIVGKEGPMDAYRRLREALQGQSIQGVAFDDISLLRPNSPAYLRLVEQAVGPGRFGVGPAAGHILRNLAFEDAYVYFL